MNDISREYGRALYELAAEEGLERALLEETETVRAILTENPSYIRLLSSPEIPKEEREGAISEAFSEAHPYISRFLRMMVSLGYSRELCEALSEYKRLFHERNGIAVAHITSAVALSDEEKARLLAALSRRAGKEISPEFEVEPSLLGGVRVVVDGVLLDGTVKHRLDGIRGALGELTL